MKISNIEQYYLYVVSQLKRTLEQSHKSGFVLGVSGGIDSAVMLAILAKNFDHNRIHAFYIVIDHDREKQDIELLSKTYNIPVQIVSLKETFLALKHDTNEDHPYNLNNFKPKLRALYLYNIALKTNSLVISCLNYSEYYLGYFTKYGDSQGDIFPLSGLSKPDIYDLARSLRIPESIINKPPSPGFDEEITDEKELGFSYQNLDDYFYHPDRLDPSTIKKIENQHQKNLHKAKALEPSLYLKFDRNPK